MNQTKLLRVSAAIYLVTLSTASSTFAQHWTNTGAPGTNWTCVASSADGLKAVAGVSGGLLYLSTNGGINWFQSSAPAVGWNAVLSSPDGNILTANGASGIYVSHDSGTTWHSTGQGANSIACSSDGTTIFATGWFSTIRRSLDGGTNWSDTHSQNGGWNSIACSADGTFALAVESNNGNVFYSTNSGLDWQTAALPNSNWIKAYCSADGNRLIAAGTDPVYGVGQIYVSTNAGVSWELVSATGFDTGAYAGGIASSVDGKVLAEAKTGAYGYPGGNIFVSWNSGDFWILTDAPFVDWSQLICSADGSRMMAATASGIYALNLGAGATLPARGTNGNALLQAVLNPAGNETVAWFEWGDTPNLGNATTPQTIGNGGVAMFTDAVTNLDLGKDYYFRVMSTNASGVLVGEEKIYRAPVIQLVNGSNLSIDFGSYFDDPGAFVTNENDVISISGSVDTGAPGVYILTYSTTNSLGITATTNRTVTVLGPQSIIADLLTNAIALRGTLPAGQARTLDPAIVSLTLATAPDLWIDESDLASTKNQTVFAAGKKTISALATLARRGNISSETAQQWSLRLLQSDRLLAFNEINAAIQAGAQQHQIMGAAKLFAAGDQAWDQDKIAAAAGHYQSAWQRASKVLAKLK